MPAEPSSINEKNSPCAISSAACSRQASSVATTPPPQITSIRISVSGSSCSAPSISTMLWPQSEITKAIVAPKVASAISGTTWVRIPRGPARPTIKAMRAPPSNASSGESPAQSMYGAAGAAAASEKLMASPPACLRSCRSPMPEPAAWH
ncbi:unannotated protein [freshwater metagenome]|uniref:Unannotated protein n=1 Tax=freshwater metagenome TaxID=449393 RepID=A0A6J7RFY5_9ZZZZ